MSVQISIDQQSLSHLHKQMELLRQSGKYSLFHALTKVAFKIKTEAQMRLRGKNHIVTSRLRNSIYVQANDPSKVLTNDNRPNYSDNAGNQFNSELITVALEESELAVGTNVEYGVKIENKDSYIGWALRNVNVQQSVAQDMRDAMKFGNGVIPKPKS